MIRDILESKKKNGLASVSKSLVSSVVFNGMVDFYRFGGAINVEVQVLPQFVTPKMAGTIMAAKQNGKLKLETITELDSNSADDCDHAVDPVDRVDHVDDDIRDNVGE